MITYRAAYVPAEPGSIGAGIRLTTLEDSNLPDDELMAKAVEEAAANAVTGEIVIGDWKE